MSLITTGLTAASLAEWPKAFAMAWPIAFLLILVTSRLGFAMAFWVMRRVRAP